jgi:hypothetical protein
MLPNRIEKAAKRPTHFPFYAFCQNDSKVDCFCLFEAICRRTCLSYFKSSIMTLTRFFHVIIIFKAEQVKKWLKSGIGMNVFMGHFGGRVGYGT